ncbi:PorV/PorQ family protein [bacterium]|nr:PorV/PorQ family protein [bacterium]
MKHLKIILIIIFLLSFIFPENNASDFLATGVSARALALGNTYTAVGGHIDGVFFNPATLVETVDNMEFTSTAINNFEEVDRKNIGWATTPKNLGFINEQNAAYGINYSSSTVGNILKTSWGENDRPETDGTFESNKHNITLTYSKQLNYFWKYGLNVRKYSYNIGNYNADATGLDFGIIYLLPKNYYNFPLVLGLTLHNIGRTNVNWSTGHTDAMPIRLNLGVTTYRSLFNKKLLFSTEIEKEEISDTFFRFGTEYWLVNNMFALRAGLDHNLLTYGLGLNYHNIAIDYAQSDYGDLGLIRRITISYKL